MGRKLDDPHVVVLAASGLAVLPDGDAAEALLVFDELRDRLVSSHTLLVRFDLWRATADTAQLVEAKRLLDELVGRAPEEYRGSMLKNVRLHRQIMEAWEANQ